MASQTTVLLEGDIEVVGRMPWSSNATFAVNVCFEGATTTAVYKPARGERPLWDFPSGLYRREVAAYELSQWLSWEVVPTTVVREEAPLGEGSLQWYVDADHSQHYFTLLEDEATHDQLRRICVFDILVNNTDRKGGHCLVDGDRHIWGIDNGLAFHAEFKLRTVIWDFAGEAIPDDVLADVAELVERGVPESLRDLLDPFERDAILTRARALLDLRTLPTDTSGHAYPWPLV